MANGIYLIDSAGAGRKVSRLFSADANGASKEVYQVFLADAAGASRRVFPAVAAITARTPTSGSTAGGFVVTLTGSGFINATGVRVNSTNVACTVVNDTQIRFTMPATGAGTQTIYVVNRAGASNGVTISTTVPIRYIVQNGVPQVPWAAASVAPSPWQGNTVFNNTNATAANYGMTTVKGYYGRWANNPIVDVQALATSSPVSFSGFSKITFVFTQWSRDGTEHGYYRTSAGIFSNRTVGQGGGYQDGVGKWPETSIPSMLAGWYCWQASAGTYTLSIPAGVTSAYVGLASGGGEYGNGGIVVSNIYLSN